MELIIVTGMSGAGKSLASNALEDLGYYCVDNMPPALMPPFLQLCRQSAQPLERIALVTDVRSGCLFEELQAVLPRLQAAAEVCRVLFLDCNNEVLRRRFKETRRQHPLAGDDRPIELALQQERLLLAPLFDTADYRIDTTYMSTAQLRSRLAEVFRDKLGASMTVHLMSFGFKYGYPAEADIMLDARCLPNPFYIDELRPQTGMDAPVQAYVMGNPDAVELLARITALLEHLLPLYEKEGRTQLSIAIGCTGGKHRSVTLCEALGDHIAALGYRTVKMHRDASR